MQSVPITTNVVSFEFHSGEVYSIQHYVIKFVSDLQQVDGKNSSGHWLKSGDLIYSSQRHTVINHCDRRITHLGDIDISFALFNIFTYFLMPFGWYQVTL